MASHWDCHIWLLSILSMISCFLQRLLSPKNGFPLRLSYLTSIKIVHDLLLPVETTVLKEWLPTETVIFDFCQYCPWSLASCRDYCPQRMASHWDCHIWLLSILSMISCFLQRLLSPKNGFPLRLSYLTSIKIVHDLLLPVETTVLKEWLPTETVIFDFCQDCPWSLVSCRVYCPQRMASHWDCHIWLLSRLSMISCFLQRLLSPKNGFPLRLSYLTSVNIVHDLLFPAESTVPKEWLPTETVIFDFCQYCPWSLASCRDYCPQRMASHWDCHIWLLSILSMISCFLQRLLSPKNGFPLRLSYLTSVNIVHDLLLPAETTVPKEWLPTETVIFDFCQYCPWSLASCRDYCPQRMASHWDCHIWLLSRLSMISCFLQRLLSPKNGFPLRRSAIFGFYQDCPWSLASCRDYCPQRMASCWDWTLNCASYRMSQQEAQSWDSLGRKPFFIINSLGRKQKLAD